MKSLNDGYVANHGNSSETFADLMFCALVVLVLFVLALAIEVSERVRAELQAEEPAPVEVVEEVELVEMTKEEVAELSRSLQEQASEINALREKLAESINEISQQEKAIASKVAALAGEQRFTGAREPASLNMAYDYSEDRYLFIPARASNHADRRLSGESNVTYASRKTKELVAIALQARMQRQFTLDEATAIYEAFSQYQEVEPTEDSYRIISSDVGITYHVTLCGYIAGDTDISDAASQLVVAKLLQVYQSKGLSRDEMYPMVTLNVDEQSRTIDINGVELTASDLKEILLSIEGRGAMLDLEGLSGSPPKWLAEGALTPAGYISKIPKAPSD